MENNTRMKRITSGICIITIVIFMVLFLSFILSGCIPDNSISVIQDNRFQHGFIVWNRSRRDQLPDAEEGILHWRENDNISPSWNLTNWCSRRSISNFYSNWMSWDFCTNFQRDNWSFVNMEEVHNGPVDGSWIFKIDNKDPQLISPIFSIQAEKYKKILINMANQRNPASASVLEVFWKNNLEPFFSEDKSQKIEISNGGAWHEYSIDLSSHKKWKGIITQIRIDPIYYGNGNSIGIDYIELIGEQGKPELLQSGSRKIGNKYKYVVIGPLNNPEGDLIMRMNSWLEYEGIPRQVEDTKFPGLLISQDFTIMNNYSLDQIEKLKFSFKAKLLYSHRYPYQVENNIENYEAAQFQIFFIIQNKNSNSPDYGDFYWLGVPVFYDGVVELAEESFKPADADHNKGIFVPAQSVFANKTLNEANGEWVMFSADLLPLAKDGIIKAYTEGVLKSQNFTDYYFSAMNMGWEMPGLYEGEIQIRNLNLAMKIKE